jgi:3-demethylubiquinone-9 3-methyltransferase
MTSFELEGQKFNALNGGPKYKFNEAISFFISVETQQEVDYFWDKLTADGGEESNCGWLKDTAMQSRILETDSFPTRSVEPSRLWTRVMPKTKSASVFSIRARRTSNASGPIVQSSNIQVT